VEIDIRRSGDGRLVLSHDPVLGEFLVSQTPWGTLSLVDLGGGLHPVSLHDVLVAMPQLPLNLEVKNWPMEPGFEPDHGLALETAAMARPLDLVTCFYWPTVDAVRIHAPAVQTGLLINEGGSLEDAIDHAVAKGHGTLCMHWSIPLQVPKAVEQARLVGLDVLAWTVNDVAKARRLAELGASGIITDDAGTMRTALREDG
jgi:glycerophosphoryl diester phosphodiesterase